MTKYQESWIKSKSPSIISEITELHEHQLWCDNQEARNSTLATKLCAIIEMISRTQITQFLIIKDYTMNLRKKKWDLRRSRGERWEITGLIGAPSVAGDALSELMDRNGRHDSASFFSFVDFDPRVRVFRLIIKEGRILGF